MELLGCSLLYIRTENEYSVDPTIAYHGSPESYRLPNTEFNTTLGDRHSGQSGAAAVMQT
jgi:hypothetical protein